MAPRPHLMCATSNCRLSEGSFFMPQSSVFLTRAPANGSKPARLSRGICANFWALSLLRRATASKLPSNIPNKLAMRSAVLKLTLWAQAPYTFSS